MREDSVKVGGRVVEIDGRTCLKSATHTLVLPARLSIESGRLAVVNITLEGFKIEGNLGYPQGPVTAEAVGMSPGRELELNWSGEQAEAWRRFLQTVRGALDELGLMEVTTPSLVVNPGMEPELEPFATDFKCGSKKRRLFLTTSPEQHLKQLIVAGFTDIYEVKTVFRNEEHTDHHQPEFQMLEWYRAFAGLSHIEDDLNFILERLCDAGLAKDWEVPRRMSMGDLCREYAGFDLRPDTAKEDLAEALSRLGESFDRDATWNDLFHQLYVSKVEPRLPGEPLIVYDFPPSQAALARINERGFADRFELYWRGMEIGNAFGELTDPQEQRRRFERDQDIRVRYGKTPLEIDENFMRALECGLPESGGIAVGLDRLFMAALNLNKIHQTRPFPVEYVTRRLTD